MRGLVDLLTFCACCARYLVHQTGLSQIRLVRYLQATHRFRR
jgi:hypothetical protein